MKNDNILVSVIVPVYGTEMYLPACIESVCNQTYKNLQIILVDDQSPDRCPEICDEYAKKDSRIVVIHQENRGVSGARNAGIKRATGEYVTFVDSDDELYPEVVELLLKDAFVYGADIVSAIKKVGNKQQGSVAADEEAKISVHRDDEALLLSLRGDKNTNSACAKLFRSSFIDGCFFEEGKNINEDGFFVFQCYVKKTLLVQHDVVVYKYNVIENSNSKDVFSEKYFSMLYFCEKKKRIIKEKFPQYMEQAYNMEVRTHLQFLDVLCRTDDKKYKDTYKESVRVVRRLKKYHKPINSHHKMLAWIVSLGLYPLYKAAVRFKYYR